jgi:HK97 family phage portal protein
MSNNKIFAPPTKNKKEPSLEIKSFNLQQEVDTLSTNQLFSHEVKAFMEAMTLKSLFYSEDWVHITVDLLASEISRVPMKVYRQYFEDGEKRVEEAPEHPVQKILDNPNKYQDDVSYRYNEAVELLLMGNAISWYAPASRQLIVLPAEQVSLDFNDDRELATYQINTLDEYGAVVDTEATFDKEDILHIKRPNPNSLYWGLSAFTPGAKAILFNRYSQDWLNSFYLKSATGQFALQMDRESSEKSAIRMLKSYEQAFTGRRNWRRTMLLPKGVSVVQMSQSIADQRLIELVDMNRETILNLLRVPKHALSLQEAGSLGSEEHKQSLKYMYTSTVIPTLSRLAAAKTKFFRPLLGDDHYIDPDLTDVELLKDDQIKKAELAERMLKTHTPNEVRSMLYDLDSVQGGDELLSVPKPQFVQQRQVEREEPAEEPLAEREESSFFDSEEFQNRCKKAERVKELVSDRVQELNKSNLEAQERKQLPMISLALDTFVKMAEISANEVLKASKKGTKDFGDDIDDSLPEGSGSIGRVNQRQMQRNLQRAYNSLRDGWKTDYTQNLEEVADLGYNTQLGIVMNENNRDELEALASQNRGDYILTLEEQGLDSFSNISRSTSESISRLITEEVDKGSTVGEIIEAIGDSFKNVSRSRAETIARTEVLTANSLGQAASAKDASEVIDDLVKVWITAGDNRVRGTPGGKYANSQADHFELQGEQVEVDEPFSNGLMYPREPGNPASEVINCRCTMVTVSQEDLEDLGL